MAKHRRRMAGTKEDVVLRLLRGEDMETVSRESGFALIMIVVIPIAIFVGLRLIPLHI